MNRILSLPSLFYAVLSLLARLFLAVILLDRNTKNEGFCGRGGFSPLFFRGRTATTAERRWALLQSNRAEGGDELRCSVWLLEIRHWPASSISSMRALAMRCARSWA